MAASAALGSVCRAGEKGTLDRDMPSVTMQGQMGIGVGERAEGDHAPSPSAAYTKAVSPP
jgi:hypothetical protein